MWRSSGGMDVRSPRSSSRRARRGSPPWRARSSPTPRPTTPPSSPAGGARALPAPSPHAPAVSAGGGGGVRAPPTRIPRRTPGRCVFPAVPLGVLESGVRPDAARPLIGGGGDLERILGEREPLYREFAA